MNCRICNSNTDQIFIQRVMNKYDVKYFLCCNCGFVFTEEPYWLDEAYKSAINISDTGIVARNLYYSRIVATLIYFLFGKTEKFVDYAGGYGIFTRLMRDTGFDFYWQDLHCSNILARGFEYNPEMQNNVELITAFEVFEHLDDPLKEISKMFEVSTNLIFSTVLLPSPLPKPDEWWYYGFEHGQHVSFYSYKTMLYIAEKFGLSFYSFRDVHIFTRKKLNIYLFKSLIVLSKLGLFFYVKKMLKSKTWDDHLMFSKQNPNRS